MNRETKHEIRATRNWLLVILLLGLIVLLVSSLFSATKNIKVSKQSLQETKKQYQEMYERGESIEELLSNFQSDFGFERYVRENFGVVRPGEKIILIVPDEKEVQEPRNEEEGQD